MVLPKSNIRRKIAGPKPATIKEIMQITARNISKKTKLTEYSKKHFNDPLAGKDWMHPKVRRVLEQHVERHLFETKITSREKLKSFLNINGDLLFSEKSVIEKNNLLRNNVLKFATNLSIDKKYTLNQRVKLTRTYLEHLERKLNNFVDISKQDWGKVKLQTDLKNKINEKDSAYYAMNARDASAHIGGIYSMQYLETVSELIHASKELEKRLK
ncbi:MAG: hypothetical protein PHX27_03540 [Candidatus ainarchaeum sp.]|nr:hypothetical protein [Candidatus ainarchaeum sp.]